MTKPAPVPMSEVSAPTPSACSASGAVKCASVARTSGAAPLTPRPVRSESRSIMTAAVTAKTPNSPSCTCSGTWLDRRAVTNAPAIANRPKGTATRRCTVPWRQCDRNPTPALIPTTARLMAIAGFTGTRKT